MPRVPRVAWHRSTGGAQAHDHARPTRTEHARDLLSEARVGTRHDDDLPATMVRRQATCTDRQARCVARARHGSAGKAAPWRAVCGSRELDQWSEALADRAPRSQKRKSLRSVWRFPASRRPTVPRRSPGRRRMRACGAAPACRCAPTAPARRRAHLVQSAYAPIALETAMGVAATTAVRNGRGAERAKRARERRPAAGTHCGEGADHGLGRVAHNRFDAFGVRLAIPVVPAENANGGGVSGSPADDDLPRHSTPGRGAART